MIQKVFVVLYTLYLCMYITILATLNLQLIKDMYQKLFLSTLYNLVTFTDNNVITCLVAVYRKVYLFCHGYHFVKCPVDVSFFPNHSAITRVTISVPNVHWRDK